MAVEVRESLTYSWSLALWLDQLEIHRFTNSKGKTDTPCEEGKLSTLALNSYHTNCPVNVILCNIYEALDCNYAIKDSSGERGGKAGPGATPDPDRGAL